MKFIDRLERYFDQILISNTEAAIDRQRAAGAICLKCAGFPDRELADFEATA